MQRATTAPVEATTDIEGMVVQNPEDLLQGSGLYIEDYSTYTYRDAATTAEWNVQQSLLTTRETL